MIKLWGIFCRVLYLVLKSEGINGREEVLRIVFIQRKGMYSLPPTNAR